MQASRLQGSLATQSFEHTAGSLIAFLLAQASVMYTCYSVGHTHGVSESGAFTTEFPYTLNGLHIVISFCLGVCAVGLWLRRVGGSILSLMGLVSALVTYGYWHFSTMKYLSELQNNMALYRRVQQEVGWFHGATKWDFLVLALVGILLLWQVAKLTKVMLERRGSSAKD